MFLDCYPRSRLQQGRVRTECPVVLHGSSHEFDQHSQLCVLLRCWCPNAIRLTVSAVPSEGLDTCGWSRSSGTLDLDPALAMQAQLGRRLKQGLPHDHHSVVCRVPSQLVPASEPDLAWAVLALEQEGTVHGIALGSHILQGRRIRQRLPRAKKTTVLAGLHD